RASSGRFIASDTWSKKTLPAAGGFAAGCRRETKEVSENHPQAPSPSAGLPRRSRDALRDDAQSRMGQAWHRVRTASANELGPQKPHADRRDPANGLGPVDHDVRDRKRRTLCEMAQDQTAPET